MGHAKWQEPEGTMQRTAVLYAVAAATLAGALLLVIPKKAPPPPEPPPVPTVKTAPITHLSYADNTLAVDAKLDRGQLIAAAAGEPVYLDLRVEAVAKGARAPLSMVLVIDRSGSMAGEKIDNVRLAAQRMIKRLSAGDQLGIISYGTDVSVDLPLTGLDDKTRLRAQRVVNALEEGGGTNIDGGLRAAARLLNDEAIAGRVARVILLSDGQATEGERRISKLAQHGASLQQRGIGLSTLGVGLDYHEDLMERLAVEGGGRYHYLKRSSMLGAILSDELQHASQVVARDVTLQLPADLGGLRVAAAPGHRLELGQVASLPLGSLASGEVRHVLVRLERTMGLRSALGTGALTFAAPEVRYQPLAEAATAILRHRGDGFTLTEASTASDVDHSRRADVRARVMEVEASLKLTEAMGAYSQSDVKGAVRTLEQNIAALEDVADKTSSKELKDEAENLRRVLRKVKQAAPSSSAGADLVKAEKARAYELRR
jgi:Ca-activated chloride channel family protein